jgi:hypothetical protein
MKVALGAAPAGRGGLAKCGTQKQNITVKRQYPLGYLQVAQDSGAFRFRGLAYRILEKRKKLDSSATDFAFQGF